MATSFPSSLQDLDATRGTSGDRLDNPNHITHHQNEDDTIEALQAKVGVDNSAVTTSLDYIAKNASSDGGGHVQTAAKGGTGQTSYTKGDILVASNSTTLTKLPIGSDGLFLKADSSESTGVKWSVVLDLGYIVITNDDFTGTTIDTSKWSETDPNSRVSQSGAISISNPHSNPRFLFTDRLQTVAYNSNVNGISVAQCNLTWSGSGATQETIGGMFLYNPTSGYYAGITSRASAADKYRLIIYTGSTVYDNSPGIDKAKDVKIFYNAQTSSIRFYYWDGTRWTQMGTSQTYSLGVGSIYMAFSSDDNTGYNGSDTITIDDAYFTKVGDYGEQYPTFT